MNDLVTFGETMALFLADPPRPLRSARRFVRSMAGAEANLAVGVARLGLRSAWFGRLGDDPLGWGIHEALRAEGVDVSRVIFDDEAPTGVLVRDHHPERRVTVFYQRAGSAASRLGPGDIDWELLKSTRLLHVTGITPALSASCAEAVREAMEVAGRAGIRVSFDPNLRLKLWREEEAGESLGELAGLADLVLVGLGEGRHLSGRREPSEVAEWFLERGAGTVVVKRGVEGSWATDGDRTWKAAAHPVTVVDPVGAGDAFAAGFLCALLEERDVGEALRWGNVVASLSLQYAGDLAGLPHRRELEAILDGAAPDVDR